MQGVVDLSFGEVFVGRAVECAIRTDDPMVSRRHARIYFQDGRHVIEDLGSANGIFVGDVRTPMHAMSNGDNIRCGSLMLTYANDGMGASPGYGQTGMGGMGMGSMGGPPPSYGGGGAGGFGGPPPAGFTSYGGGAAPMGGPPPAYDAPMGGPPPAAPSSSGAPAAPEVPDYSPAEFQRMQRRIDQLTSEVRLMRGGGDQATRMEELEEKISRLEKENRELTEKNMALAAKQGSGGPVRLQTAALNLSRVDEVVNGLHDVLSELRINVLAAEGEVENWAHTLPTASFELVRESLRSCRNQMETSKDLMRQLREQRP